ncbi:MAG: Fur family transcriptional regulator [Pelagibacterales bacterium]|nr:Fur family transcriptional regulator [Pelagibacterales bacterium]
MKSNDELVLDTIKHNAKPLTAYEILSKVQRVKKIQPMTVYRSLKNLQSQGKIHKSNQNKKFFLCNENHNHNHNPILVICKDCGKTEELEVNIINKLFSNLKTKAHFQFKNFQMEVSSTCRACN